MTKLDDIQRAVLRFRNHVFPERRSLYEMLAKHQAPQVLFIACIDSRVEPSELCNTGPGDMFVERTPGNLVPIYGDQRVGVSASIEYAVTALQVTDIIICGHSDCGALKGALDPGSLRELPAVERWLHFADEALDYLATHHPALEGDAKLHMLCEQNVITQIEHLKTHPCIQRRLEAGDLRIHGWLYEIHTGEVHRLDPETRSFALWPDD